VISVVVLQNEMVLQKGELRSSSDTHAVSILDGNQVTGVEAERGSSVREEKDQEPMRIAEIKLEPTVSGVPFKGFIICVYSALVLHAVHGTETYCRLSQHLLLDQSPYSGLIQLMVCMI
jgi:hypothetical protein